MPDGVEGAGHSRADDAGGNEASIGCPEESGTKGWRSAAARGGKAFIRHPLGQLLVFLLFLYQVKECYPFTHVPMYSDPEGNAPYLFLADGEGDALPIRHHCGVTNPKLRKMYRSRLSTYCDENGIDGKNPPASAVQTVADDVFSFLRERSEVRKRPLPDDLQIIHVLIEPAPAPDGFKETFTPLARSTDLP